MPAERGLPSLGLHQHGGLGHHGLLPAALPAGRAARAAPGQGTDYHATSHN